MEVEIIRLDLNRTRADWPDHEPFQPAYVRKQPVVGPENWFVVDAPLVVGEQPNWAFTEHDPYVRVPLFLYSLTELYGKSDMALAYFLQLGISCAGYLPGNVKKLLVVTGVPVDLLYDESTNTSIGIQFWCGLAVTTKQGV